MALTSLLMSANFKKREALNYRKFFIIVYGLFYNICIKTELIIKSQNNNTTILLVINVSKNAKIQIYRMFK